MCILGRARHEEEEPNRGAADTSCLDLDQQEAPSRTEQVNQC